VLKTPGSKNEESTRWLASRGQPAEKLLLLDFDVT